MKGFNILLVILPAFLLSGCGGDNPVNELEYEYRITPLQYPEIDKVEDVAPLVDSIIIIQPETTENSLLGYLNKIVVTPTGEYIVWDTKGIYHFSGTGQFKWRYGQKGRADNEYIIVEDIAVQQDSMFLYILDGLNKVLVFDINNGEFRRYVNPERKEGSTWGLNGIIPKGDGGFYLFSANNEYEKTNKLYYGLHEFARDGKKLGESLPNKDFVIPIGGLSQTYHERFLVKPLNENNIVHEISDVSVTSLIWVDFGEESAPEGAIYNKRGEQDLNNYFESHYYKNPCFFQQTSKYVSFVYAGPKNEAEGVFFSKEKNTGFRLRTPGKRSVPITFLASDGNFLYSVMSIRSEEGFEDWGDPLTRYIIEQTGFIKDDDNPLIVGVKFNF